MGWLRKAKSEKEKVVKAEVKARIPERVEEVEEEVMPDEEEVRDVRPGALRSQPELVSRREMPKEVVEDEPQEAQQREQPVEIPDELKPESAKFYEQQKPVVQQVMFLPLQPELRELIVVVKQLGQLLMGIGNLVKQDGELSMALLEAQKELIKGQQEQKVLLERLIKEIELASQGNQMG